MVKITKNANETEEGREKTSGECRIAAKKDARCKPYVLHSFNVPSSACRGW